jgi:hypothetical protein
VSKDKSPHAYQSDEEEEEVESPAISKENAKNSYITIRAPKEDRAFWQFCAKLEGTTITDLLVNFLTEKYGTFKSRKK